MCGIVGAYGHDGSVSIRRVQDGLLQLFHRGPDGTGTWMSPSGVVGLGHARLSIIDIDGGRQPIANEDDSIYIVVNGEFYGFEDIRRNLEQKGHKFRTHSDSEIALHLYETYGYACLEHLRGEFAFILWDEKKRTLFAARDRFGVKPLYVAEADSKIIFASEIKALLAMGVPARWDRQSVYQAMSTQYCLQDRTLFNGVQAVPPGHFVVVTDGVMKMTRYWDLDYPTESEKLSEKDCIEQYRDALTDAIRVRLRADVPVSCYLSGGLDSSAIAGLASKQLNRTLRAYTVSFDQHAYDEEPIAKETADMLGVEFVSVKVPSFELVEHFSDSLWHSETLAFNAHGVAKYLLSREVQQSSRKVVLTGEGADETLAGYPSFLLDMYSEPLNDGGFSLDVDALEKKNALFHGVLLPAGKTLSLLEVEKTLGFVPGWMKAKASVGYSGRPLLHDDILRDQQNVDAAMEFIKQIDVEGQLRGRPQLHQSMYLYCKASLPSYVLTLLGDRMEMAHSIEGRLPFLDHKLFETVRRFPPNIKIKNGVEKYILREAAKPFVNASIYARTKHGFAAPAAFRAKGSPMHGYIHDILGAGKIASFLDVDRVRSLLNQWEKAKVDQATQLEGSIMTVLSASLLERRFGLS